MTNYSINYDSSSDVSLLAETYFGFPSNDTNVWPGMYTELK